MGVTVVITPLVALLNDQVAKLRNYGVSVCYITSSMLPEERDMIFHELTKEAPCFKLFYLTPESALSPQVTACFQQMAANKSLSRFVIDEAHCIDTWGQSSLASPLQHSLELLQPKLNKGLLKSWGWWNQSSFNLHVIGLTYFTRSCQKVGHIQKKSWFVMYRITFVTCVVLFQYKRHS